jgi:hypothetical protein
MQANDVALLDVDIADFSVWSSDTFQADRGEQDAGKTPDPTLRVLIRVNTEESKQNQDRRYRSVWPRGPHPPR